jgi:peroxiredoxin/outer membrane lipoprotein-sorting protein
MKTKTVMLLLSSLALAPVSACADKAGDALLQKCVDAETKAQAMNAHFTHQYKENGNLRTQTGTVQLKKPNMAHIVVVSAQKETTGNVIINSDGRNFVTYAQGANDYSREPADMGGGNIGRNNILETAIFFNPDLLNRWRSLATGIKVAGAVSVGSTNCQVLRFDGIPNLTLKVYIGPDGLIRGATKVFNGDKDETHLVNVKADGGLTPAAFRWQPPPGAKTVQEVAASMEAPATGNAVSLLPAGRKAPDFTLKQVDGSSLNLASVIKSHKAVLLNFWSYFCGPCREELPHLSKMQIEFSGKGLQVVSVNGGDSAETIAKFCKQSGVTHTIVMDQGKVSSLYGVQAIPTNYVIGADGKIIGAYEGFDEAGIRQSLAKAGVK